jgi:hypothetical protein
LKKLVIGHKLDESTVSTTVWLHCLGWPCFEY